MGVTEHPRRSRGGLPLGPGGLGTTKAERGGGRQAEGRGAEGERAMAGTPWPGCRLLSASGWGCGDALSSGVATSEPEDRYRLGRGMAGVELPWDHPNFLHVSLGPHDKRLH